MLFSIEIATNKGVLLYSKQSYSQENSKKKKKLKKKKNYTEC